MDNNLNDFFFPFVSNKFMLFILEVTISYFSNI